MPQRPSRRALTGTLLLAACAGAATLAALQAASLTLRLRPRITIWFHQPHGVIDESGGRPGVEHRFSALTGLQLRRLVRYPGSAAGWQNHRLPSSTAFVSELPAGRLVGSRVNRYARAVRGLGPRGS